MALEEFYGPNSTRPSANCFCVESYFASAQAIAGLQS
jgi:hypothetical protein